MGEKFIEPERDRRPSLGMGVHQEDSHGSPWQSESRSLASPGVPSGGDAMCGSARPDQEALAQAALTSRDGPVGPDLGKAPLQEAEQARAQMAFLEQEIHAGRPALQV